MEGEAPSRDRGVCGALLFSVVIEGGEDRWVVFEGVVVVRYPSPSAMVLLRLLWETGQEVQHRTGHGWAIVGDLHRRFLNNVRVVVPRGRHTHGLEFNRVR